MKKYNLKQELGVCKTCNCEFIYLRKNTHKQYCSRKCKDKFWTEKLKTRFKFKCSNCGKDFYRNRRKNCNGDDFKFCSKLCSNIVTGKKLREPRVFNTGGYVLVYDREYSRYKDGRVPEHVLVYSKHLNRKISKSEPVHHKNHIRDDNEMDNLFLCKNNQEHNFVEKMSRWLLFEFLKERKMSRELTEFMNDKFFSKYKGNYQELKKLKRKDLYELFFSNKS